MEAEEYAFYEDNCKPGKCNRKMDSTCVDKDWQKRAWKRGKGLFFFSITHVWSVMLHLSRFIGSFFSLVKIFDFTGDYVLVRGCLFVRVSVCPSVCVCVNFKVPFYPLLFAMDYNMHRLAEAVSEVQTLNYVLSLYSVTNSNTFVTRKR